MTFGNARILDGTIEAAANNGYAVTVQVVNNAPDTSLRNILEQMKRLMVDGVIVVLEQRVIDFNDFKPDADLPVVLITEKSSPYCPTIDADQYGCSVAAVNYLLNMGHKTVYHISGPSSSRVAESRAKGWQHALGQQGIPVPSIYIGDWGGGPTAVMRRAWHWPNEQDCTAIYAASDQMAYGAIEGLQAAGKKVPADVSVIGVDDSLVAMIPRLSLTTMRMNFEKIGREAFAKVMSQCEGEPVPINVKTLIPARLIERGSVRKLN